jgi:hypothetical protein
MTEHISISEVNIVAASKLEICITEKSISICNTRTPTRPVVFKSREERDIPIKESRNLFFNAEDIVATFLQMVKKCSIDEIKYDIVICTKDWHEDIALKHM